MRTETIIKQIFTFDELSDAAKKQARDWWRDCENIDSSFSEFIIEDAAVIADILGVVLCHETVKLMGGGTRSEPVIYWSGFGNHGDGACFQGTYYYKPGSCKKIREHAPQDADLHAIADTLRDVQKRYFFQLFATISHRGRYHHEHSVSIDVEDNRGSWRDVAPADVDAIADALRDFMRWIFRRLEAEYDYIMSDENVDESIRINEYEFNERGRLA